MNTHSEHINEQESYESKFLNTLSKENSFEVPTDFFEAQRHQIRWECMRETNAESGFALPENYFLTSAESLRNRLVSTESSKKVVSYKFSVYKWYAAAAMLFVVMSVSVLWYRNANILDSTCRQARVISDSAESVNIAATKKLNTEQTEIEDYLLNHYSIEDLAVNE